MLSKYEIIDYVLSLTVTELKELGTALENKYGNMAITFLFSHQQAVTPPEVTEGNYYVSLVTCGPQKINVIKVIRQYTGVGLKEAKDMTEHTAPHILHTNMSPDFSRRFVDELIANGAVALRN